MGGSLVIRCVFFGAAVAVCVALLAVSEAGAGRTRALHVTWNYDDQPEGPVCTGYQLYRQGQNPPAAPVCTFTGGDTRAGDCLVDIMIGPNLFTLTAIFVDGSESGHGDPIKISPTVVQIR